MVGLLSNSLQGMFFVDCSLKAIAVAICKGCEWKRCVGEGKDAKGAKIELPSCIGSA